MATTRTILGLLLAASAVALHGACGSEGSDAQGAGAAGPGSSGSGNGDGGEAAWIVATGSGGCDSVLYEPPLRPRPHVEECSVIEHHSNPPTSGPHYPRWASFRAYDQPVPRGHYLHSLEHGAVVLAYNCDIEPIVKSDGGAGGEPAAGGAGGTDGGAGGHAMGGAGGEGGAGEPSGCAKTIARLKELVSTLPEDPMCAGKPSPRRVIITPDPELDVPFAVAAWGHMLKAQCLDEKLVAEFIERHYGKAPEDTCATGIDPTDPIEGIPDDCGT